MQTYPSRVLNFVELSDLKLFQEGLEDGRIKDLLDLALHNLEEYQTCGTPWDCRDRMEWLKLSPEDVRKQYNWFVKQTREYIADIKELNTKRPKERKRRVFEEQKDG